MSSAQRRPVALVGVLALLVCCVIPASQYLGNVGEFLTAPGPLAALLVVPPLLAVVVTLVIQRFAGHPFGTRFSSAVAMIILLAWLQAYLLVWDYGLLDGSPIDWQTPWWRGWVDLGLWAGGLTLAIALHRRLHEPLAIAACVVVGMQLAILASQALALRQTLALNQTRRATAGDIGPLARFSPERNVVHLVLDSFQADVFKDIIEGPAQSYFRPALQGFTFFEENLGTFPATYLALPALLSGRVYTNQEPQAQFMESVYAGKSILNAAHDAGYEVDLAADAWFLNLLMQGRHDNAYMTTQPPRAEEAARLLDLGLFRLAPHWLKPAIYDDQRWLLQRWVAKSDLLRFPYFTHNAFLADITRRLAADRAAPVYKYIHLMTTHAPFVVNPDCSYAGRTLVRVRETVTAQSQCSLAFVVALLERMKQAGVYDNSLIIIMGDHGGHIPPHRYREGSFEQGGATFVLRSDLVGLATPLLAIKPPGATAPLRVSTALSSSTDVAATIDALLGLDAGMPGRSLFDPARDPAAPRHFYGYQWSKLDPVSDYIAIVMQYLVTGSAYDIESWSVGEYYPAPDRDRAP